MIDLHCHLLYGIDDGAQTQDQALALARQAVQEGIEYSVLTPHHRNGHYNNYAADIRQATADFQTLLDQEQIPLTVFPGQEVRIHEDLLDSIMAGDIQCLDPDQTYLLLEFPTAYIPAYAESLIYDLIHRGMRPVIAHPERNHAIQADPDILLGLIDMGCLSQLTCASYVGHFDKQTQTLSKQLIEANLIHVLSSDAHDLNYRNFFFRQAFDQLKSEFGPTKVDQFINQAKAIVNGDPVDPDPPQAIKKKQGGLFRWFKT